MPGDRGETPTWSRAGEGEQRWFVGRLATIRVDRRLTIDAGAERFQLRPGGTAVVPMGVPHTFRVDSDTARVLVLSTPAGLERLVRDGSVPARSPTLPPSDTPRPSAKELALLFEAHGQVNVGPPVGPDD
jgi:hypothetical protein